MVRTQIYLDENLINNLRTGAKLNKTSVSEYIRDLLNDKIKDIPKRKQKNPFAGFIKVANSAPKTKRMLNLSENIDKYLPENLR